MSDKRAWGTRRDYRAQNAKLVPGSECGCPFEVERQLAFKCLSYFAIVRTVAPFQRSRTKHIPMASKQEVLHHSKVAAGTHQSH